jgi:hypothetical protein
MVDHSTASAAALWSCPGLADIFDSTRLAMLINKYLITVGVGEH